MLSGWFLRSQPRVAKLLETGLLLTNNVQVYTQVRTATKRAAGSKTHMKDSAGRRLGSKKHEGQIVKTGEIIYRQRGTNYYPGENTDIGKDHTIYAMEPGFVRYYLDPFHPKRKFIGVALTLELRLPTDHWDPRVRRFGYEEIQDPEKAKIEAEHLSKKDYLLKQKLEVEIAAREEKRKSTKQAHLKEFQKINNQEYTSEELDIAGDRLLLLERYLRNGFSANDSYENATFNTLYDYKLALRRGEIDQQKYSELEKKYVSIAELIRDSVEFTWNYKLTAKLSLEEKTRQRDEIINKLKTESLKKAQVSKLLESAVVFTQTELVGLRRQYMKPVRPETVGLADGSGKNDVRYQRYNYVKGEVESVFRSKEAFSK